MMDIRSLQTRSFTNKPPVKLVVYGETKVGKTTFAADAPSPVFIALEPGLAAVPAQFVAPVTLDDVRGVLRSLRQDKHEFQTVCIDSLDWLEPLVHSEISAKAGKPDAALGELPFGSYEKVAPLWREILAMLDALNTHRKMHIVCIAHTQIRNVQVPDGKDYSQTDMKLLESRACKISGLVQEWADAIGYARFELTVNDKKKALSTGERVLDFGPNPAFVAGCRFPIEPKVPLEWGAFYKAWEEALPRPLGELKAELTPLLEKLSAEDKTRVQAILAENNARKIQKALKRVKEKVAA